MEMDVIIQEDGSFEIVASTSTDSEKAFVEAVIGLAAEVAKNEGVNARMVHREES